jgi:hypothetical protein
MMATVTDPQADGMVRIQLSGANDPLPEPVSRKRLLLDQKIADRLASRQDDPHAMPRRWKDASGRFAVVAYLEGVNTNQVRLRKIDGSRVVVPLERLSDLDRETTASKEF